MFHILFFGIIGLFAAMLFLNIFFRVKVLKYYKYLVQNNVEFGLTHFLHEEKMNNEILIKYPEHRTEILAFVTLIRRSVTMASILIALILAFGYLLMKFR